MKFLQLLILPLLLLQLVSCAHEKKAKEFKDVLEAEYGANFTLVKTYTLMKGYAVYQNKATGEYMAVNVDKYDSESMNSFDDWSLRADANDLVRNLERYQKWESELKSREVTDYHYEWVSYYNPETGKYYDVYEYVPYTYTDYYYEDVLKTYYTNGVYTFQIADSNMKDLEKLGGLIEQQNTNSLAGFLSSNYALSDQRSVEVAKLLKSWGTISQSRNMTQTDMDTFSKELLGTDLQKFQKAYELSKTTGNKDNYEQLIKKAASHNGVTPEHMTSLINNFIK